ncbi:MAG: stage 0 sporulation family protein [Dehalococcoidia bacterium]|jgi:cell fate regulator YaaT (PSP1 superfamily)
MSEVIGIRFKSAGKIYYFDPSGVTAEFGEWVVVETGRGPELGKVVIAAKQVPDSEITEPLKPVLRKAMDDDFKKRDEFADREREILDNCIKISNKLNLPMKFITAECNLDGSRVTVYFSAEGRIDFRDLLKELTSTCRIRVELRQVGPRDEAKLLGGHGKCGLPLCCASFLSEFSPVSIKMAKEQDLPLNPTKISGTCGRLLCCLSYESSQYRALKEKLPPVGQQVNTPVGTGIVIGGNPLKETVSVRLESEAVVEVPLEELNAEKEKQPRPPRSQRRRRG